MEGLTATGAGVVIVAVVLILRTVFEFLEKMSARKAVKADGPTPDPKCFTQTDRNLLYDTDRRCKEMHEDREKIQKLFDWHDQMGPDGVPVWYVRKALEDNMGELAEAITQLTRSGDANAHLLQAMFEELRSSRRAKTEGGS